jgi:hypothetical protein
VSCFGGDMILDWPTFGRGSQTIKIVKNAACTRGEGVWSILIR